MWPFKKRTESILRDITARLDTIVEPLLERNPDGSFKEEFGHLRRANGKSDPCWPTPIQELPRHGIKYVEWIALYETPVEKGDPRISTYEVRLACVLEPRSEEAFVMGLPLPSYPRMNRNDALEAFKMKMQEAYRMSKQD